MCTGILYEQVNKRVARTNDTLYLLDYTCCQRGRGRARSCADCPVQGNRSLTRRQHLMRFFCSSLQMFEGSSKKRQDFSHYNSRHNLHNRKVIMNHGRFIVVIDSDCVIELAVLVSPY